MSLEYIRQHYGVPAFEGREVIYTWPTGERHQGVIVGAADDGNAYLMVLLPGLYGDEPVPMHPMWEIEYPAQAGGENKA